LENLSLSLNLKTVTQKRIVPRCFAQHVSVYRMCEGIIAQAVFTHRDIQVTHSTKFSL